MVNSGTKCLKELTSGGIGQRTGKVCAKYMAAVSTHADDDVAAPKWSCARGVLADVLKTNPNEERLGGDAAADALRHLPATRQRPIFASNISPPALFRVIKETRPTLLIDEAARLAGRRSRGISQRWW
jgi:hypothetical protein